MPLLLYRLQAYQVPPVRCGPVFSLWEGFGLSSPKRALWRAYSIRRGGPAV